VSGAVLGSAKCIEPATPLLAKSKSEVGCNEEEREVVSPSCIPYNSFENFGAITVGLSEDCL
jgi:hypothetical protein